ncbi:MAG: hypothetical protein ACRDZ7_05245, partial [Acidimicrobiia bacterium]
MGIWPFSRHSDPDPDRGAAAEAAPVAPEPAAVGEWTTLPAVQPTFEPIGPILGARAFEDSLATLRAPQPFLAPLGHDVTGDAPPGTVGGIVNPDVQRFAAPPPTRFGVLVPDTPAVPPASPA